MLKIVRVIIFIARLNGLEMFVRDVGNAFLEIFTKEKLYIIVGA